MSGIVGLSMQSKPPEKTSQRAWYKLFSRTLFWVTFHLMHIGQKGGGVALVNEKNDGKISISRAEYLLSSAFKKGIFSNESLLGMSITNDSYFPEPHKISRKHSNGFPEFAIVFSGKLINREELEKELIKKGLLKKKRKFRKYDDARIIARLLVSAGWQKGQSEFDNFFRGFCLLEEKVKYTCVVGILTKNAFYAWRDPHGRDILIIGKGNGFSVIASEDIGFYNQKIDRDGNVEAGQLVCLKNGRVHREKYFVTNIIPGICSFKSSYYSAVSTIVFKQPVGYDRMAMGVALARRDIKNGFFPDYAMPILFSGLYHWLGYVDEFARQVKLGLISKTHRPAFLDRYPLALRSFLPPLLEEREEIANQKQIPLIATPEKRKEYENSTIAVLDDSRVSGLQFQSNLIPKIVAMSFKRENIHARIGNPLLCTSCRFGKAGRSRDGLIGYDSKNKRSRTEEEIAKLDGIGSIVFNTRDDYIAAIGYPSGIMCTECSDPNLDF